LIDRGSEDQHHKGNPKGLQRLRNKDRLSTSESDRRLYDIRGWNSGHESGWH